MTDQTTVYLVPFHSEPRSRLNAASNQYRVVEQAISSGEWPYDNGDDPSFYMERHGGRLTWGVCRPDLRNLLQPENIVVFFSFTTEPDGRRILYRLCAVATVEAKLDHRAAFKDARLKSRQYINTMIKAENGGWRYDENDRPAADRHGNWLWRMAEHKGMNSTRFKAYYADVYKRGWLSNAQITQGAPPLSQSYVLFSRRPDQTFVSPFPPLVARAQKGSHEVWFDQVLRRLTIGTAEKHGARGYLRTAGQGYVHRHLRFEMNSAEALAWRVELIRSLQTATTARASTQPGTSVQGSLQQRLARSARGGCG